LLEIWGLSKSWSYITFGKPLFFRKIIKAVVARFLMKVSLTQVNKLATFLAVKTAIEIEDEFAKKGFSPDYVKRALTSIAPEVIRADSEGSLGHFAIEFVTEIKKNYN
jgi:hypothetical protein